jgi:hypothetical protein
MFSSSRSVVEYVGVLPAEVTAEKLTVIVQERVNKLIAESGQVEVHMDVTDPQKAADLCGGDWSLGDTSKLNKGWYR